MKKPVREKPAPANAVPEIKEWQATMDYLRGLPISSQTDAHDPCR
jgi:hypothetical protein